MTLSESASLTPEQLRVAVAERMGWTEVAFYEGNNGNPVLFGFSPDKQHSRMVPDYPNDLNACAEFEKTILDDRFGHYCAKLGVICADDFWEHKTHWSPNPIHATATQRCRAFLAVTEKS